MPDPSDGLSIDGVDQELAGSGPAQVVSLRSLLSDTAVYGLASVADRAIGFLLLPVITSLLSPSDFGIVSLFTISAHLSFVICSLGIHQAFLRCYTEERDVVRQRAVLNTSLTLAIVYWVVLLPLVLAASETLNRWIFGIDGSALVLALAAVTIIEVVDAVASIRLQADGRPWAYFWIRISSSITVRTGGIILILLGSEAWGWIVSDAVGRLLAVILLAVVALPEARLVPERKLIRPLFSYGALLVPSLISFYIMTVADKIMIRALTTSPLEQVGFYSVGERIAGVMHLANLAFIFGWQRFAFRNMHLKDGPHIIARGMLVYALAAGYLAMSLALLGDDLTHWLISARFEPGMIVIPPLTLAAMFGGLAAAAEVGLHKKRRPHHISSLNAAVALLNVALNFVTVLRWGIAGAAVATMICQGLRWVAVAWASQQAFPIPVQYGRLATGMIGLMSVLLIGQLFRPFGWTVATVSQLILVLLTPVVFWKLLPATERRDILRVIRGAITRQ